VVVIFLLLFFQKCFEGFPRLIMIVNLIVLICLSGFLVSVARANVELAAGSSSKTLSSTIFLNTSTPGVQNDLFFPTDPFVGQQFGNVLKRNSNFLFVCTNSKVYLYGKPNSINASTPLASWSLLKTLQSDSPSVSNGVDGFGSALAVNDGFVSIGAPLSGKVFVYSMKDIQDSLNQPESVPPLPVKPFLLQSPGSASSPGERFGSSMDTNSDYLAIGSPGSYFGSVYLFKVAAGPSK
jgi:hypothetical protein